MRKFYMRLSGYFSDPKRDEISNRDFDCDDDEDYDDDDADCFCD